MTERSGGMAIPSTDLLGEWRCPDCGHDNPDKKWGLGWRRCEMCKCWCFLPDDGRPLRLGTRHPAWKGQKPPDGWLRRVLTPNAEADG